MSCPQSSGRWWIRPVLGLIVIAGAVAGIILARHAAPSPRPATLRSTTSAAPSTSASSPRADSGSAKPWSYQTATPSIDTAAPARSAIATAATLLLTDRHDSSGNLRTWDRIDERLTRLATPGLRVWFTEIPAHQTRGIVPGERVASIDYRPTTASMTVWDGTIIVRLVGPAGPRDLSVHARAVPFDGAWRLDTWDIDGDDGASRESAS